MRLLSGMTIAGEVTDFDVSKIDPARAKSKKYKMPVPFMNVINGGDRDVCIT